MALNVPVQTKALESLSAIDGELSELQASLNQQRDALEATRSELRELEERLASHESSISDMDRTRGELIQEVRQMSVQIDRSREKLSRCRTEREANAVQRELEELRKLQRDRELEIQKIDGLTEQAQGEIDALKEKQAGLAGELGSSEGDVTNELGRLEAEVASRQAIRAETVTQVDKPLYRKYEMIRKRRGSAVASTTLGTCSACNMMLPPMMFQQLRRGETIDQCPSCNRLIYYVLPSEADDSAEGAED